MLFNNDVPFRLRHRQLLPGVLSPVVNPGSSSTSDPLIPTLPIPSLPSLSNPLSLPTSLSTSRAGSQPSSVLSSRSLTSSTFSSSSSTSSSSSSSSSPSPTPASSVVQTLPGGSTTVVIVQASASASVAPVLAKPGSFLNNKTAEGIVFALVGVAVLIIIFLIATFAMRRKRRGEIDEILSFDPAAVDARTHSMQKSSSLA